MEYQNKLPNIIVIDGAPSVGKTLVVSQLEKRLNEFGARPVIVKFNSRNYEGANWIGTTDEMFHWLKVAEGDKNTHYIFDQFIASYFTGVVVSGEIPSKHAIIRAKAINDKLQEYNALHYILTAPSHMLRNNYARTKQPAYTEPKWDVVRELWRYNLGIFSGSIERTILSKSDIENLNNEIVEQTYNPRTSRVLRVSKAG